MATYVFRVRLAANPEMDYRPHAQAWRDIEIAADHTLANMHEAIFEAFDRWDDQEYAFVTRDEHGMELRRYVAPSCYEGKPSWPAEDHADIDRSLQRVGSTVPDAAKERYRQLRTDPPQEGNAAETTIGDLEPRSLGAITYQFDLDRGWEHQIDCREKREAAQADEPAVVGRLGPAPDQYPSPDE